VLGQSVRREHSLALERTFSELEFSSAYAMRTNLLTDWRKILSAFGKVADKSECLCLSKRGPKAVIDCILKLV